MLWVKALHVIFMVTWFAGLFYLPRLFVYHAMTDEADRAQNDTFKIMERKLLRLTHVGGALTVVFGLWLLVGWRADLLSVGWMQAKLGLVVALLAYHASCVHVVRQFAVDANRRSHIWYRWFNEVPVIALFGIVILVIVQPG